MRTAPLLAALALAGCNNIGSPQITSTEVYAYTNVVLGDTLSFHWPRSSLPVRVWVASDSPILADVDTALARWQGAFLYGEFRAVLVADSGSADVIVRNEPSDIGGGLARRAKECTGETDLDVDISTNTLQLPVHMFVYPAASDPGPGLATCYRITTTHEFGHALGFLNPRHEGATPADVMYADPVFDGISDRDRWTAEILYLVTPTVTITGRR